MDKMVQRHCEGDSPKQSRKTNEYSGLLRYARNDVRTSNSPSFGGGWGEVKNHRNLLTK